MNSYKLKTYKAWLLLLFLSSCAYVDQKHIQQQHVSTTVCLSAFKCSQILQVKLAEEMEEERGTEWFQEATEHKEYTPLLFAGTSSREHHCIVV